MTVQLIAVLLLRFTGLLILLYGVASLAGALLTTWDKVGLVYWKTFVLTVVLPPVGLVVGGILIGLLAGPLGRLLTRGLNDRSPPAGGRKQ